MRRSGYDTDFAAAVQASGGSIGVIIPPSIPMIIFGFLTGASIGGHVELRGTDEDYVHFIYFSLVSLTTVGFGDVYPINAAAKMLATALSTLGVLFPAIVIARLVGLASSQS